MLSNKLKKETLIAHLGEERGKYEGAVVPPIFQNSLFTFDSAEKIDDAFSNFNESFIYTRGNNPTVKIVEEKIAALEEGEKARLFTSGMAAISSALLHFLNTGDHVVCVESVYGPTQRFIKDYLGNKFNIEVTFVLGTLKSIEESIKLNTKIVYLESPSSGIFSVQDLSAISKLAKKNSIYTIIDNTWATPIYQNPIKHGIDVVVHSVSKYISGHSDVVAGVIVSTKEIIDQIFNREFSLLGGKISPFEAWLILRGMRTLPVRMRQHSENAWAVIEFLKSHKKISNVLYPGYESHEAREIVRKQMNGMSGLLSFEIDTDFDGTIKFINNLKIFKIGVSWGGYESLAYAPIISLSKEMTKERLEASGIHPGIVRISVGLEHVEDLIADISQALDKINLCEV